MKNDRQLDFTFLGKGIEDRIKCISACVRFITIRE